VRQAFLLGKDAKGSSFDHRKTWLVERIKFLGEIFAIDIAAYAVMSNHYHLVLHVDKQRAEGWTDAEVCRRWGRLYHGPELLQRFLKRESLADHEQLVLKRFVQLWRQHLHSLSRFMACLNYVIALRANGEEACTGRFWQGRFKSQALKDESALLACMVYVDLNPVRAGIARDLESSDFTSIQDRIRRVQKKLATARNKPQLMVFDEVEKQGRDLAAIPFRYRDYLQLVDWHSRAAYPRKPGAVNEKPARLLNTLGLNAWQWALLSKEIGKEVSTMLHGLEMLEVLERRAAKLKTIAA
jgi:REP element-mobilizing transposase RayT